MITIDSSARAKCTLFALNAFQLLQKHRSIGAEPEVVLEGGKSCCNGMLRSRLIELLGLPLLQGSAKTRATTTAVYQ